MTAVEAEIKLSVADEFGLPPLTDPDGDVFAAPRRPSSCDATYFDTDDLRLARAGASLRDAQRRGMDREAADLARRRRSLDRDEII